MSTVPVLGLAFETVLPWVLALVLALVHYFGESINDRIADTKHRIGSFSAGVTVTYIFLVLFPEMTNGTHYYGDFAFIFALIGFTAIRMTENWVVTHERDIEEIRKDYREIHSVFLFSYNFAIGMVFHYLTAVNVLEGMLFFVPVLLHTAVSSISLKELDEEILDIPVVEFGVSSAFLFGVSVSYLFTPTPDVFHVLLSLVTGTFLYLVIHDGLTAENSAPISYSAGIVLYTLFIVLTWMLV